MSLDMATTVGGDYIDWVAEVAVHGPFPIVAKIVEYHGIEQMLSGSVYPVTIDVLFCGGSRKGEVERGEKVIGGGVTGTLRGVRNPKKDSGLPLSPPAYPVGHELGITVNTAKNGAVIYAVFNAPLPEHVPAIHEVYAGGQGWANAAANAARKAAQPVAAAAPVPAYQPTVIPPSAPAPAPAAPAAPEVPAGLPAGVTPEMWAAIQAMQAGGMAAAPVGGPPAPRSWS